MLLNLSQLCPRDLQMSHNTPRYHQDSEPCLSRCPQLEALKFWSSWLRSIFEYHRQGFQQKGFIRSRDEKQGLEFGYSQRKCTWWFWGKFRQLGLCCLLPLWPNIFNHRKLQYL